MPDPFWFNDPSIIINSNRLIEFFPNNNYTLNEKLNSLVRLGLYISLIFIIYKKDINWISIFIFILSLTYYLQINYSNKEGFETNLDKNEIDGPINAITDISEFSRNLNCTKPDKDNPFMNVTMGDLLNTDTNGLVKFKPSSCDTNDPNIKKSIDDNFKSDLFRDINDLFGKYNSQRQFFTMPWTDIIPDSNGDFKNWLYKQPSTCHENPDHCIRGNMEDVRAKSYQPE